MVSLNEKPTKRIFNSIEEINATYGVNLKLPDTIPNGTNVLCYSVVDLYRVELFMYFKETSCELLGYVGGVWEYSGSDSIEEEIKWDSDTCQGSYIYLRVPQKENKDKFIPERLLGVETNKGYIVSAFGGDWTQPNTCFGFETTNGSCFSNYDRNVKYYISDESDETVSFNEYLNMFFDV